MPLEFETLTHARTLLSVPGHRPDRFGKAAVSGADAVMLDLEDAVGPELKPVARANVDRWLGEGGAGLVRINDSSTPWYDEDVAMLAGHRAPVLLPKASDGEQVVRLLERLAPGTDVMVLLETGSGILDARAICSVPGVARAMFGNVDLAAAMGIDHADRGALAPARSQVVLASMAARLAPPMDGLTTAVHDEQELQRDVDHAAALGFTGKLCIHPCQVPAVNASYAPSASDLRWARDVVASAGNGSVTVVDGQLVAKPVVDKARRILAGQARP
ncbi:CoA ester lyase [Amycolatopsis rubida]|uniref:CoA ester lyase n=1 Tax=Amycolatopsis rubida TaxID=112413 RepID=A0ABX0BTM1_9PSEU|nr:MULTISPECIES: CoA ester lyase [Amycolatopsis]MYW91688.1 HpcH/HpaI aldolase/citrate lyase family protein [Amycolatopsis rubida]NEC56672.1 CoA ester lyase [Amycolatopsis rubida]OAP20437.1 Citrate lyase subunit beta-like protein [Amycolatopsis sp. M39]